MRLFTTSQYFHFTNIQADSAFQANLTTLDDVFNLKADKIISKSDQSEIFSCRIHDQVYFIKRYFRTKGIASWFGFSRFRIETRNQLWFNQSKLPSAKVVAYGEDRFLLKTKRAVLITEGIENTMDLAEIAKQHPEQFRVKRWRDRLIEQTADILRFFHQHRFCHNDLHWRNILIQHFDKPDQLQIFLIDCPFGRRLFWPFLNYKIFKDLANIDKLAPQYFSRTQRLRFFLAYRQITTLGDEDKAFICTILKHKAHRLKRKAREKRKKNK